MTIAVIDYGMGNLHSVAKALEHVTHENVMVTRDPRSIRGASRLVLPGQGAIRDCMGELQRTELEGHDQCGQAREHHHRHRRCRHTDLKCAQPHEHPQGQAEEKQLEG